MNPCKYSRPILLAALVGFGAVGCASQSPTAGHAPASAAPVNTVAAAASPDEKVARTGQPAPAPPPTEQELAAGIQVLHIGVTASGGLVDARFKVLDGAKATALLSDTANAPQIIAGDTPPLMAPHHAIKAGRYAKDQTLFILYPNTRQAVKPNVEVYVAFGATRLGPITAQ